MRKNRVLIAVLVIVASSKAHSYGGSNFDLLGYSDHDCRKPIKPTKPFSFHDQWQVDSYNSEVNRYNLELQLFMNCINEYLENAQNDINEIRRKAQKAINYANGL